MFSNFFKEAELCSGRQGMQWWVGSVLVGPWGGLSEKVRIRGPHAFWILLPALWFLLLPPVMPLMWTVSPSLCCRLEGDTVQTSSGGAQLPRVSPLPRVTAWHSLKTVVLCIWSSCTIPYMEGKSGCSLSRSEPQVGSSAL